MKKQFFDNNEVLYIVEELLKNSCSMVESVDYNYKIIHI